MKVETINAVVADIPFKDLFVSDLNPRTVLNEDDILALADNIKALGLIQNLAGLRREDGLVGIVAGGAAVSCPCEVAGRSAFSVDPCARHR